MVRPHYVTQRVGDEYVLVRVDPVGHVGRCVSGALGTALAARGLRRGGLFCSLAGAALLYHAFTGRDPLNLILSKAPVKHGDDKDSPSFPGEASSRQLPNDAVDEASMESFPAAIRRRCIRRR